MEASDLKLSDLDGAVAVQDAPPSPSTQPSPGVTSKPPPVQFSDIKLHELDGAVMVDHPNKSDIKLSDLEGATLADPVASATPTLAMAQATSMLPFRPLDPAYAVAPDINPSSGEFSWDRAAGPASELGLVDRFGKQLYQQTIVAPVLGLGGRAPQDILKNFNVLPADPLDEQGKVIPDEADTPEQAALNKDTGFRAYMEQQRPGSVAHMELDERNQKVLDADARAAAGRAEAIQNAIGVDVAPAKSLAEKAVDVGAGTLAFVAKLALLRKAVPSLAKNDAAAFEIINQIEGGPAGHGAIMGATMQGLGSIPAKTIVGKAGKLGAESAALGGITAMQGGDKQDVAISTLIPFAMRLIPHRTGQPVPPEVEQQLNAAKSVDEVHQIVDTALKPGEIDRSSPTFKPATSPGTQNAEAKPATPADIPRVEQTPEAASSKPEIQPATPTVPEQPSLLSPEGNLAAPPAPSESPREGDRLVSSDERNALMRDLETAQSVADEPPAKPAPQEQSPAMVTNGKEPHEMTFAEVRHYSGRQTKARAAQLRGLHRGAVEDAIEQGKRVPPEVLAEYPDLAQTLSPPAKGTPAVQPQPPAAGDHYDSLSFPELRERVKAKYAGVAHKDFIPTVRSKAEAIGLLRGTGKPASPPPLAADAPASITIRRAQLESQLRDAAAMEMGFDKVYEKAPRIMRENAMRGSVPPGHGLKLEDAIAHAEAAPDESPAKLHLHNLRELEKNPRGSKFIKVNTSDVEDGSRVVVNDRETFTIDREEGLIKDGITAEIPEGGVDVYGKKLLPPELHPDTNEPIQPDDVFSPEEVHQAMVENGLTPGAASESVKKLQEQPHAVIEGQQPESAGPQRPRAGEGGTPAEAGGGDRAAPVEQEPAQKVAATSDTGIFDQEILRPATGSKQAGLFHEPTAAPEIIRDVVGSKSANDAANTAAMFDQRPAAPAKPAPARAGKPPRQYRIIGPEGGKFVISNQPGESKWTREQGLNETFATPEAAQAYIDGKLGEAKPSLGQSDSSDITLSQGPTPPSPPATGKLDQLESWAREQIAAKDRAHNEAMQKLTPEQRRQRGSAGSLDPERLLLHTLIGAAKIGKGAQRFVTWSREMLKEFPDIAKAQLSRAWVESRRFVKLDEEARAAWIVARQETPAAETVKQTIGRVAGQLDTSTAVSEMEALRAAMAKARSAATSGYRTGVAEVTGLKRELARVVRENLPPEHRGKMLDAVARINTLGEMRLALRRASEILADHDVKQAIAAAEKLAGTMKLDPILGPKNAPKLGPKNKPATVEQPVDLTTLPEPARSDVRKLVSQMKVIKNGLVRGESSVEEKYAAIDQLEDLTQQVRQHVADDRAAKETRIGDKVKQREAVVGELVNRVDAPPEPADVSGESPRDASLMRRLLGRGSLSMETITQHLDPDQGDVHGVTIQNVRRAQENFYGEQKRWNDVAAAALKDAGYEPGTLKLDRFINEPHKLDLPDAGDVTMTRNQMLGLAAAAGDPQTMNLIRGREIKGDHVRAGWNFKGNALARPFTLSEADVEAIHAELSPAELQLIDAFKDYNKQQLTAPLMSASIDLRGWAPDPHEGYFPRQRNRQQLTEAGVPAGWRDHFKSAMENISSLKERAPDLKTPLFVPEFIQDTFKYVEDAAKVIHLAEPVRSAAMVWEDPRAKGAIERKFGRSMNARVDQFLADTMMVRQRPPMSGYEKYVAGLMRNVSRAWLQLNPSPMAKNVFGGTAKLMPAFEMRDWAHGVTKMFSPEVFRRMVDESSIAWNRYHGGLYGQYSPLSGKHVETVAELKFGQALKGAGESAAKLAPLEAYDKLGQATDAIELMEWADSVPFRTAYAAAEHFVERTMPTASAEAKRRAVLDKFHEAVYQTQNGTSSTEISGHAATVRKNPIAQALLMFTSDNNKSFNLLARLGKADNATRAKTVLAIGLNAALAAGVGYGISSGVAAAGRAISGAPVDPDEQSRRRSGAVANTFKNLFGTVYFGDKLFEALRSMAGKGDANIADPATQLEADTIKSLVGVGKAVKAYASTVDDSPDEQKKVEALHKALWSLSTSTRESLGDPTVPIGNMVSRAIKVGSYTAPDPREVERKAKTAAAKSRHDSLGGGVQKLLAEKNKLDAIGVANLSPTELQRRGDLMMLERTYNTWQRAAANQEDEEEMRAAFDDEAAKLGETVK